MSSNEAIRALRKDPSCAQLLHDSYVTGDNTADAERFFNSAEFTSVRDLLGAYIQLKAATVLDLGAGTGIASYAFARSGCEHVIAVEPDGTELGREAIESVCRGLSVTVIPAVGAALPIDNDSIDIVYARQVLHHIHDLPTTMRECTRVLKPGGVFMACREHVVDNEQQLSTFLANHPVHQLTAGEHAHSLAQYTSTIGSVLVLVLVLGPWDSIINAYPQAQSLDALRGYPSKILTNRLGAVPAQLLKHVPGIEALIWRYMKSRRPAGRLYTFVAMKES